MPSDLPAVVSALLAVAALAAPVFFVWSSVAHVARCRRENARRSAAWRAATARARRDGRVPPFPPNRVSPW